ncbi:MAG: PQQ-dependent sugar dehydrogenase [Phycisphaerales bacterium]|nr:PQQ-dependent sugar dehydrogenase [Phycisphaerales bacterium]
MVRVTAGRRVVRAGRVGGGWCVAAISCAAAPAAASDAPGAATDPGAVREPGFVIETIAEGLIEPTAIEFAPDGRLFVAERDGTVRIVRDGRPLDPPFAAIEVFTPNENGLLGMAIDPDFERTGFIFVFATVSPTETQILRLREGRSADGRPSGVADDVHPIRDSLPTRGTFHSGGGLRFGPDGMLYFSIGDNLIAESAQDHSTLAGKISRIAPDGSTPADNPLRTPTGSPRAIYATGLRNVFRFCFAPDGRLFAMDVGSDGAGRREEINLIKPGANYGWPQVEGRQGLIRDPRFTDPIHDYHEGGAAPVGAVVYAGGSFPVEYDGNLLYLEYVLNRLYRLELSGDSVKRHSLFAELTGGPVDLTVGPHDGALYYCELASGTIRRIRPLVPRVQGATQDSDGGGGSEGGNAPAAVGLPLCGLGAAPALFAAPLLLLPIRRGRACRAVDPSAPNPR